LADEAPPCVLDAASAAGGWRSPGPQQRTPLITLVCLFCRSPCANQIKCNISSSCTYCRQQQERPCLYTLGGCSTQGQQPHDCTCGAARPLLLSRHPMNLSGA
jgi:hypothetical protein